LSSLWGSGRYKRALPGPPARGKAFPRKKTWRCFCSYAQMGDAGVAQVEAGLFWEVMSSSSTRFFSIPVSIRDSGPRHGQLTARPVPGPAGGKMDGRGSGSARRPSAIRCLLLRAGPPGLHRGETLLGGGGGRRQDLGAGGGPTLRAQEGLAGLPTGEGDLGRGAVREPLPRLHFPHHHLPHPWGNWEGVGGSGLRRGTCGLLLQRARAAHLHVPKSPVRWGEHLPFLLAGEGLPPPPPPVSVPCPHQVQLRGFLLVVRFFPPLFFFFMMLQNSRICSKQDKKKKKAFFFRRFMLSGDSWGYGKGQAPGCSSGMAPGRAWGGVPLSGT